MSASNFDSKSILVDGRALPLANYPHAKKVGPWIFVSDMSCRQADGSHAGVAIDAAGDTVFDVAGQTRAVLDNLRMGLAAAGAHMRDLVDLTTFLVDMKDYAAYNAAYNDYFAVDTGPARTTVAVAQLPHPNLRLEIKALAYVPEAP